MCASHQLVLLYLVIAYIAYSGIHVGVRILMNPLPLVYFELILPLTMDVVNVLIKQC